MHKLILFLLTCFVMTSSFSQQLSAENLKRLQEKEDTLSKLGQVAFYSDIYTDRRDANYALIKELRDALKIENSFQYNFEKLPFIKIERPKDNSFRILSWQIQLPGQLIRHYGAIQMNSSELKLYPLIDRSDDMAAPEKFVGNNTKWYGALYYDIVDMNIDGHKKYLLFGIDTNHPLSNIKVIDVLQFDKNKEPILGFPLFQSWKKPKEKTTRFLIEYKGDAATRLTFDEANKRIVYDHLVPMTEADEGIYINYVPDGTFDALKWNKTQFEIVENIISTTPETKEELSKGKESQQLYQPKK